MSQASYNQEILNIAKTALNDADMDGQCIDAVLDRLSLENRFHPYELFFSTYADLKVDPPSRWVGVAAAIELLHLYTLVHDDIIDHHETRWRLPSLRSLWGDGKTILWGDYLATTAIRLLMTTAGPDKAAASVSAAMEYWQQILLGQMLDLEFSSRATISWEEYVKVATLKTSIGALAAELGTLFAEFGKRETQLVVTLANWAGVSSQIANDFSEVYGIRGFVDPYDQNSGRGNEIAIGRKTIFHVFFHDKQESQHQLLCNLVAEHKLNEVTALLSESGALHFAMQAHIDALRRATSAMELLNFPAPFLSAYLNKANPVRLPGEVEL